MTNELYLSQIEIGTPVCRTLAEVRAELVRLRKAVIEAAEADRAAGSSRRGRTRSRSWEDQALTPKDRYDTILQEFQQLTREQIIFGCHVHAGIDDREQAIRVMNRARPWLPPILALSANSPFWLGVDTGYASYRTELFGRFPMTGDPGRVRLAGRVRRGGRGPGGRSGASRTPRRSTGTSGPRCTSRPWNSGSPTSARRSTRP